MADVCLDNSMEWLTGQKIGAVTFSQKRMVNKIIKYAEEYPNDIEIIRINDDGTVYAHVPISWFKLSPPRKGREFTDEEKAEAAERLRVARKKKNETIKEKGTV